jgi:hypothetical protein
MQAPAWLRQHWARLGLSLRVTTSALLALALAQCWTCGCRSGRC